MTLLAGTRSIRLGLVIFLLLAQPINGQVKKRVIPFPGWSIENEEHPIRLGMVEIKLRGKTIDLDHVFEADENWLRALTLRVRNVSNKTIVAFDVGGGLIQGLDEELPANASYQNGITWNWGIPLTPQTTTRKRSPLRPGAALELNYRNVDQLTRRVLAKPGEGSFCKLKFSAPAIQYANGSTDSPLRIIFHRMGDKPHRLEQHRVPKLAR